MKRTVLLFVIAGLVTLTFLIWGMTARFSWNIQEILMVSIAMIIVLFAIIFGIKRVRSLRQNEPVEDEMSKGLMEKASSVSYYISIYLWLGLMAFSDRWEIETHTLIGAGILGMAIILCLSWLGIKIFGFRHA